MFIHRSTWQWIFPAQSSNKDFVFDGEFFLGKNSSFLAGGHSSWPRHDTQLHRTLCGTQSSTHPRHTIKRATMKHIHCRLETCDIGTIDCNWCSLRRGRRLGTFHSRQWLNFSSIELLWSSPAAFSACAWRLAPMS